MQAYFSTSNVDDFFSFSKVAEITAPTFAVTAFETIEKETVVVPAGTVTVFGTVASVLPDVSVITSPVGPAGLLRVIFPETVVPPTQEAGTVSTATLAAATRSVVCTVLVPSVAVKVTVVSAETAFVRIVGRPESPPNGMTRGLETTAAALFELRVTSVAGEPA